MWYNRPGPKYLHLYNLVMTTMDIFIKIKRCFNYDVFIMEGKATVRRINLYSTQPPSSSKFL